MDKQGKGYTFYKVEETCPDEINKAVNDGKTAFIQNKLLTHPRIQNELDIDDSDSDNLRTEKIDQDDE